MRHRFHAICPYFAMFPEAFVEKWVSRLTRPGELVLDPFCGRGTTPFQAILMERNAIGVDTNPVAFCVSRAKTSAPAASSVLRRLSLLEREFNASEWEGERRSLPDFFRVAYAAPTLRQLLYLRCRLRWRRSRVDCMIAALVLGALHGECDRSSSYLSNQMPRTISTKPAYSIRFWRERGLRPPRRDTFALLRDKTEYRYVTGVPESQADIWNDDMRNLPRLKSQFRGKVKCVVTSPPYLDTTDVEEDQWLRLWFLGGAAAPSRNRYSVDCRHRTSDSYWLMIVDMWRSLGRVVAPRGNIVIRIGARGINPERLRMQLVGSAKASKRRVRLAHHEVSELRRRQTDAFRPGSRGCRVELDCRFKFAD